MSQVQGAFSVPALTTAAGGGLGIATGYLGYKVAFSFLGGFPALAAYGSGTDFLSIGVRFGVRSLVVVAADIAARMLLPHGMRVGFLGGAAGYVGASTLLEVLGYSVTVGQGAPLQTILPVSLQPTGTIAGFGDVGVPRNMMAGAGEWRPPALRAFVPRATSYATPAALRSDPNVLRGAGAFIRPRVAGVGTVEGMYYNRFHPLS